MSVIRHVRTPAEDGEVEEQMRNFDRAVQRCGQLGLDVLKLRGYVPADDYRGAVEALEALADPKADVWDRYSVPHRHTQKFAREALGRVGGR